MNTIDWKNDDGVSLPMINDFIRNSFYDRILKQTVNDKICLEIGFGTGLLSILALQHGAKKIVAFESDQKRYNLGKEIINRLSLENKIELIYDRFRSDKLGNFPDVEVIFCETVNQDLWGEDLYYNFPKANNILFVPGNYFFEVQAIEISQSFAKRLMNTELPNRFEPGIDIDVNFKNVLNEFISDKYQDNSNLEDNLPNGLVRFNQWNNQNYWQITIAAKTTTYEPLVRYEVAINDKEFIEVNSGVETTIPFNNSRIKYQSTVNTSQWRDKIILLIPRVGIKHKDNKIYLDNAGSWGPAGDPILLVNYNNDITIQHDFLNGKISIA